VFALEVIFHDGISPNEMIFVRRPHAIIGNSEFAHVVIEGASQELAELRLARGLGREFSCHPMRTRDSARFPFIEGVYSSGAEIDLGGVTARITALDSDLHVLTGEPPDQAGVRVLRRALSTPTPIFPALAVLGSVPLFVSFPTDQPVLIGRSRACAVRLDAADISSEHARVGCEHGRFWVEDLGSTNGTFVNSASGERVVGRRYLEPNDRIVVGSEILLAGVASMEDVSQLSFKQPSEERDVTNVTYPALVGNSDLVKPSRLALTVNRLLTVGRDPASDVWIAAAHISRKHAEMRLTDDVQLEITDVSSNGIFCEGERLEKLSPVLLPAHSAVLDFNAGIRLAVCFSADDEERFKNGGLLIEADELAPQSNGIEHEPPKFRLGEETIRAPSASLFREESLDLDLGRGENAPDEQERTTRLRPREGGFAPYEIGEPSEPQLSRLGGILFILAVVILTATLAVLLFWDK
jgi:pSer/pThr/pTyr-binding forkhead associated (FHA) protein